VQAGRRPAPDRRPALRRHCAHLARRCPLPGLDLAPPPPAAPTPAPPPTPPPPPLRRSNDFTVSDEEITPGQLGGASEPELCFCIQADPKV
jgi:hypothetical protein